jgi:catechol 2,3-dioxygenase-like lactoylglutathione lyase family enzyme
LLEAAVQSRHLTLECEDVAAGTSFFRDVLALPVRPRDGHQVDVDMGPVTATLTARSGTGSEPAPIVELEVADVAGAVAELRRRGATVLVDVVTTDYGTESAFVAGPDGLIVELYRRCTPPRLPWQD